MVWAVFHVSWTLEGLGKTLASKHMYRPTLPTAGQIVL
jgi:hypothetical protein